jgi:tetrahydromethanopterin S-methyltransferase subunit G
MAMGIQERREMNDRFEKIEKVLMNGHAHTEEQVPSVEMRLQKLEDLVNSLNGTVSYLKGKIKEQSAKA